MRGSLRKRVRFFGLWAFALGLGLAAVMLAVACGGEAEPQTVIQTVVVEGPGQTVVEKVIETVVVEKVVEGKTVMEIQTVVVEKQVTVTEKVIETVVVEKIVVATPVPATPIPLPTAVVINIPEPKNPVDTLVMAIDQVGTGGGLHSAGSSAEGAMHMGITETFFMVTEESAEGQCSRVVGHWRLT